jgi:hypothetical protein
MGDTNMYKDDLPVDYNEVDIDGNPIPKPNERTESPPEDQDWTFDDEQQEQHQAKYGDEAFYEPFAPKPPRGSVEDIQHKLRIAGARLRKSLQVSLKSDIQAWTALRRPASLHSAQRTLAEMLMSVPSADHGHFHELGDGYVYMPLHAMEKYLYPTLRVMQHLHSAKGKYEYLPGGVESMIVYSYFHQGGGVPQNRTKRDLRVLRNTVFPAGSDLPDQLRTNNEVTEGISTHLRSTLRRLRELTVIPSLDKLGDMTPENLDERQAEIDALIGTYTDQITKDYQACRLDKERLILLSHLSQEQSMEVLEAHLQLTRVMESNQIHVKQSVEQEIMLRTSEMEKHICEMLDQNRKAIRGSLMESCETITPYDVQDMKRLLESQKIMVREVLTKNAQLVTENSELRMHMSFMPVEYRDYVKNMQSSNHQQYRKQRVAPKVIVPNTDHKEGVVDIELEDAPMSHPSVQHYFRDAQYTTLNEARNQMEKGFALRQRQTSEPYKLEAPWRVYQAPPSTSAKSMALPPTPNARNGLTTNDLIVNAAYHQVMDSANTEPYSVPTSQRAPPPQQRPIRPARVSLDYRRADQPSIALIDDPPPKEESSSASPMHNPDLPADHWRNGGKGKRPPPQHASRQPHKYAKGDDRDYSSSRTAQTSGPVIPLPPNAQNAAPTPKSSTRLQLTPGEAGVPAYKGEEYQPLTRAECTSYYSIRKARQIPKAGETLSDDELVKVLTKIPDEGDPHITGTDREMSEFVMDRIDQCYAIPDDFIYEVMVNGVKKFRTIHGEFIYAKVAYASNGLYRLLDMKMIARVGDYYYSLRMRPEKKSSTYEYIPNKRYSYKDVKRTLAQINIQVTASRYWSDLALSTLDDHQLHPYFEWCPGSTIDLQLMDAECGLGHFPIGSEIVYTEPPVPVNSRGRKPRVDHRSTVARLYHLGVMDSEGRDVLLSLKAIIDERIDIATKEQARTSFAVAHRTIQIFINRWSLVSKSLDFVANPYNPHGSRVYNADAELEDRKRKADLASLTMSSPSTLAEEEDVTMAQPQQPAAFNNSDRQNPGGSGGNPV